MDNERIILESRPISISSFTNYKEAVFLISVLDEPDLANRIIPEDAGEEYHKTIIGYPIVEGYEGTPKCILIKTKLWTSRFPEYFKVFDKLWEDGNISSSWELTAFEVIQDGLNKIYKKFEFIGNCVLGTTKTPCVPKAGVIEYAEQDDIEEELSSALITDMTGNINISENIKQKEDVNLGKKENTTPVENTENKIVDSVNTAEDTQENTTDVETSESKKPENAEDTSTETASLTDRDLFRKINKACEDAIKYWGYISYWFPEEHTVWFKSDDAPTQLDYKLFTYTVENDEVTVSEPQDVKLTVAITDVNTTLAEKDEKIQTLTAELEIKDKAVITAGEKIGKLNVQISELKPYKEQVEKAEKEKIEAEIAEEKESLKNNLIKGGFSEKEITNAEIAELIEARNKSAINSLIAERYLASFDKEEVEETPSTATASLETDETYESPSDFMMKFLSRK